MKKYPLILSLAAGALLAGQNADASATAAGSGASIRLSTVFEAKPFMADSISINMPNGTKYNLSMNRLTLDKRYPLNEKMSAKELSGSTGISYTVHSDGKKEKVLCNGGKTVALVNKKGQPLSAIKVLFSTPPGKSNFAPAGTVCTVNVKYTPYALP